MVQGLAIFDNFLGDEAAADLLALVLSNQSAFAPSCMSRYQTGEVDRQIRRSSTFSGDWIEHRERFRAAIDQITPELLEATGVRDWSPKKMQIEMAVHRDGDFFRTHCDTLVGKHRTNGVRLISAVYYFFREPRSFEGGQLAVFDPRGSQEIIEPEHDRLVVFPSFLPHEVRTISVPGDEFVNARFSVNCWLNRVQD